MLTLRLIRRGDPSGSVLEERVFQGGRLTVGRGADCGWTLDDQLRTISKAHFEIYNRGSEVFFVDTSSNGVFLNGSTTRTPKGAETPLAAGDSLQLGDYVIVAAESGAPEPIEDDDIFDAPAQRPAGDDPFLMDDWSAKPAPDAAPDFGAGAQQHPAAPVRSQQAGPGIDSLIEGIGGVGDGAGRSGGIGDDWAASDPQPAAAPAPPARRGDLETAFSEPILSRREYDRDAFEIPAAWDELDAPALEEEPFIPGRAPAPEPAAAPAVAPPAAPPAAKGASDPLFQAFLDGADLDPARFQDADPVEVLRTAGEAYRQAILSFSDILRDRSYLKNEFRLERTILRVERNNPLKFKAPQDVAVALLKPPEHGFLGAAEAVRDAGRDVKKHQLASLSGLRAALQSVLDQFRPAAILERLSGRGGLLSKLGGGGREAEAWEAFVKLHGECESDAAQNADGFLARTFRKGYEEQMRKLEEL